jgi:hypothetical protein
MVKMCGRRWQAGVQVRESGVESVMAWKAVDLIEPGGRSVE